MRILFLSISTFESVSCAFNYNISIPARKLLPRAEKTRFVGMNSDKTLCRV